MVQHKVISGDQMSADVNFRNMQKDLLLVAMTNTTLSFRARDLELKAGKNNLFLILHFLFLIDLNL